MVRISLAFLLVVAVGLALVDFATNEPRWQSLAMALCLIVVWTPVKGLIFRRFGAQRPYRSAFLANLSSELTGLPFRLALGFWTLMGASLLISAFIETLVLLAMGTVRGVTHGLVMAAYASLVVHVITAGYFYAHRQFLGGAGLVLVGVLLFHLPAFFEDRFAEPFDVSEAGRG